VLSNRDKAAFVFKRSKENPGMTLVETMIALLILLIGLMAMAQVLAFQRGCQQNIRPGFDQNDRICSRQGQDGGIG
jgi:prepilin-type N-terminal cleavage/methylation domain-containing protein